MYIHSFHQQSLINLLKKPTLCIETIHSSELITVVLPISLPHTSNICLASSLFFFFPTHCYSCSYVYVYLFLSRICITISISREIILSFFSLFNIFREGINTTIFTLFLSITNVEPIVFPEYELNQIIAQPLCSVVSITPVNLFYLLLRKPYGHDSSMKYGLRSYLVRELK